jgi:hypothetical protein
MSVAGCRNHPDASARGAGSATLALRAPRAGDTLVEGHSYVIRWSAPAGTRILLLVGAPARPDSLVWRVPVGFVTGFGVASSDQVRLRLEDADSAGRYVETGPFTVTGASPAAHREPR